MKDDFHQSAPRSALRLPKRWPDDKGGIETKPAWIELDPGAISCLATARMTEAPGGYSTVYIIAEGMKPFMTFLDAGEEKELRDALSARKFYAIDAANGPVMLEEPPTITTIKK